ncbi:hypothetical protein H4R24_000709 [Coemansia sp. RSA 988]|nr:hypothetical protein H4R24_000709 [Coemansia sp. RSA 988]
MGITGLLPLLSEAQRKGHVKEFANKTVGVDSYIWLYKGAFSCAVQVGLGEPTSKYVTFFMTRARMLRHYGVEPLFVFDGGALPSKRETELERQRNRAERRQQAMRLWQQSKRKAAFEMFQKCLEATPQMAKAVIEQLKAENFRYLVAPFEADAQLAYLESQGITSASISEDSDLIVFGCQNIIFKLDQYGAATVFDRTRLDRTKAVNIKGWTDSQIRRMCILSGCDYAASAPGIGLKKAYRYVARSTDINMAVTLMRADGVNVPEAYEDCVTRAELTFLYQRVYDPRSEMLVHVRPLAADAPSIDQMPFLGDTLDPAVARDIALCEVDPFDYKPFDISHGSDSAAASEVPAAEPKKQQSRLQSTKKSAQTQAASKPAAARSGTLVSFWKKSAFATISAKPTLPVSSTFPKEPPVVNIVVQKEDTVEDDQAVRVRFRARDINSEIVSTDEQSKFFAKTKREDTFTASAPEHVDIDGDRDNDDGYDERPGAAQLETGPLQTVPAESTRASTSSAAVDRLESENTLVADVISGDSQLEPLSAATTQVICDSPLEELSPAEAEPKKDVAALFAQFTHKEDIPAWIVTPKYRKASKEGLTSNEYSPTRHIASRSAQMHNRSSSSANTRRALTPVSQIRRRISAELLPRNSPEVVSTTPSPSPLKRKLQSFAYTANSKFRCAPQLHAHCAQDSAGANVVDEIVDCSDSEKENIVCA